MLKLRVIPTILSKGFTLVKGERFDGARAVGSPMQAVQVYNLRDVDELCFFDIAATSEGRGPDLALIDELADKCQMPLTVGGGVHSVDDVRALLAVGADKVAVGSGQFDNPSLVRSASERFGAQCVVAVIDVWRGGNADGVPTVWSHNATRDTGFDPVEWATDVAAMGAGEIVLQSVDHDGMMDGYDLAVLAAVTSAVDVPVIASGGAGTFEHMVDAVRIGGASAVAAAAMFHFTQHTPAEARRHLAAAGIATRS
ncbi:MAG TPA: imidazole glycerol phosphate synthase cyclase subunit [Acidimicrobiia bacterium]|jgi:cyclase